MFQQIQISALFTTTRSLVTLLSARWLERGKGYTSKHSVISLLMGLIVQLGVAGGLVTLCRGDTPETNRGVVYLPIPSETSGADILAADPAIKSSDSASNIFGAPPTLPPQKHLECVGLACVPVASWGQDRCSENRDCGGHTECFQGTCALIPWPAADQCRSANECQHRECVSGTCTSRNGRGRNRCSQNDQCGHRACTGRGMCEYQPDVGPDLCSSNADCGHRECADGRCQQTLGIGPDRCGSDLECPGHNVCDSQGFCTRVGAPGPDQCQSDAECGHLACVGSACVQVPGVGEPTCIDRLSCNHKECAATGSCVWATGQGPFRCGSIEDCTHNVCDSNGVCQLRIGVGVNQCDEISACPSRKVCRQAQCVRIGGVGRDECITSEDCDIFCVIPKHCVAMPLPAPVLIGGTSDIHEFSTEKSKPRLPARGSYEDDPRINEAMRDAEINRHGYPLNIVGNIYAPVRVTVFHDLKCGMCKQAFNDLVPKLLQEFASDPRVAFVFREFPLGLRDEETALAVAAKCAGEQQHYLEFAQLLYRDMKNVSSANANRYARKLQLNLSQFTKCVANPATLGRVRADVSLGGEVGVTGTPTFLVNGTVVLGAFHTVDEFRGIIRVKLSSD